MPSYSRIELPEDEVENLPELKKIIETHLIAKTSVIIAGSLSQKKTLQSQSDYIAIKVPTVEGEELWILDPNIKSDYEKSVGFSKPCDIIFSFRTK
ncbi:MAG: hypothetical protein KA715_02740 [Xanthomonadaceae bacterium]|nr:hypothetical protein [Xanthomonadaceae bacterium]